MEIFDQNGDGLVDTIEFFEVVKRSNDKGRVVRLACTLHRALALAQPLSAPHAPPPG